MSKNAARNEAAVLAADTFRYLENAKLIDPDTLKPKRGAIAYLQTLGVEMCPKNARWTRPTEELAIVLDDFRKMRETIPVVAR